MLSLFPTSLSVFKDSTTLLTTDLLDKASSLFEPLSRYSSNSSETSISSISTTSTSTSSNVQPPLPLINLLVLSHTSPLRSSSQRKKAHSPRPTPQRKDTPMYINPREKGLKKVELKAGGWVGVREEGE